MTSYSLIKRRLSLLVCKSTQQIASTMSESEGLLITSEYQTQGQGQRSNYWQSQPGKNLLLSLVLRPNFLSPHQLFYLNIATSLSLYDLLSSLSLDKLSIKWPNDICVGKKKVAGILIDSKSKSNALRSSVVGIGLNVNQESIDLPRATSLSLLLGKRLNREQLLENWTKYFALRYFSLRSKEERAQLRKAFVERLFGRGKLLSFAIRPQSESFLATICGIDEKGCLCLRTSRGTKFFSVGSLEYLWN